MSDDRSTAQARAQTVVERWAKSTRAKEMTTACGICGLDPAKALAALITAIAAFAQAEIEAEREACAKVADETPVLGFTGVGARIRIVQAILRRTRATTGESS